MGRRAYSTRNVMNEMIVVVGFGPVGRASTELLHGQGRAVRVAQRTAPASLPAGVAFQRCDALDAGSVRQAIAGATQVVLSIGFPYEGAIWKDAWPRTITNFAEACAESGARLVFVDGLYMYGPRGAPLTEMTPLADYGVKPSARAAATRIWMAASAAGRLRCAALRAPDFYGPGVGLSWLGQAGFGALAKGKAATVLGSPDTPHDFAYVPDIARAVVTLLDAPDDAFGQAWHVPCAPTRSPREIFAIGAAALGVTPRVRGLPIWALPLLGLFVPILRASREMSFQWDRPYRVDSRRFAQRFWSDATPFEVGAPAAAASFKAA
jgi:nucleoside-diphosphate-sugar epimerase